MSAGSILIQANPVTAWEGFRAFAAEHPQAEYRYSQFTAADHAEGGFWSCSFRLEGRENLLLEMFENGLGRHVEVWNDRLGQDFEGVVWAMDLVIPPNRYSISLDPVHNKMWMRADIDADGEVERTTVLTELDSQGRFGIMEKVLQGAEAPSLAVADQAVQIFLDLQAWPKPEMGLGQGSGRLRLEMFCRGYIQLLGKRIYNQIALTGTATATEVFKSVVDAVGEFVGRQKRKQNSTPTAREFDVDRNAQQLLFDLGRAGDNTGQRWQVLMLGHSASSVAGRVISFKPFAPAEA